MAISVDDLKRIASDIGENMTDQELKEMIKAADLDRDKLVSQSEFLRVMKKAGLY